MVDDLVARNPESARQRWRKGGRKWCKRAGNAEDWRWVPLYRPPTCWCGWRWRRRGPLAWEPPFPSAEYQRVAVAWGPLASPARHHRRPLKTGCESVLHQYLIYKVSLTYVIVGWIRVLLFTVISTIIVHVDLERNECICFPLGCFVSSFLHVFFGTLVAVLASPSEVIDFNSIFSFFSSSRGGFSLLWRFSGLANLKEMDVRASLSGFSFLLSCGLRYNYRFKPS